MSQKFDYKAIFSDVNSLYRALYFMNIFCVCARIHCGATNLQNQSTEQRAKCSVFRAESVILSAEKFRKFRIPNQDALRFSSRFCLALLLHRF
jgi:hypothetical protein